MKRQLLILFTLVAVLICMPIQSADAAGGRGHRGHHGKRLRHSHGHGFGRLSSNGHFKGHGHGFGHGLVFGGLFDSGWGWGWDLADLYRELYKNLPHFSLHPPVYYSHPVPRTYGYSPFAYPPGVMTPEVGQVQPLEIINPHVPNTQQKAASVEKDRTAATHVQPEPLVIINPFVTPNRAVAQSKH
jgi:hypothetical protein